MLVSLGLIGMVGAVALSFLVASSVTTREQANRQAAAQLASRSVDTARALGGAQLLAAPPPTASTTVNGVAFTTELAVTLCRQSTPGAACSTTVPAAPGIAELVHVAVDVRWQEGPEVRHERAAILLNAAVIDPTFAS
jgi:type II secretory pathway pseudopilin PulG